jgi:hypothetical protein
MGIAAYFDESERDDAGAPICVGGYLFKETGYKKFRRKWRRDVLKDGALEPFHMTDLCAGRGCYEGMSIPARVGILDGAVDAIGKHTYAGIGIHFNRDEFVKVAPPEWPDLRGSIYTSACHMCLQTTAYWLRTWKYVGGVLYVFERGHKFQAQAHAALTAISQDAKARGDFLYANHVFEDKNEFGLQAADLFAWTMTKANATAGKIPAGFRPFVPAILRLASANRDRQKIYPFTGQRLARYIDEQLHGTTKAVAVEFGPKRRMFR